MIDMVQQTSETKYKSVDHSLDKDYDSNMFYRILVTDSKECRHELMKCLGHDLSARLSRYFLAERPAHGQSYSEYF